MSRAGLPEAFDCAVCGVSIEGPFREWPAHCGELALGVLRKKPRVEDVPKLKEWLASKPPEGA